MKTKKMIYDSLQYIDEHLEENLTVSEISSAVGYSESLFPDVFIRK